jgi:hypothetical protein
MQVSPLLERLDWVFALVSWVTNYPSSLVTTLSRDVSDHMPCLIVMSTDIPKSKVFRFENYWLLHDDFMQVMQHGWNIPVPYSDKAKRLGGKFKNLRRVLRNWYSKLSNLKITIANNQLVLSLLDAMEESRDLSLEEWNFRKIVQSHLANLLEQQRIYWQQRGRIKWAKLGTRIQCSFMQMPLSKATRTLSGASRMSMELKSLDMMKKQ